MRNYLILGVYLFILENKPTTARQVAEAFEVSLRTVYRYVDDLCSAGVPIITLQGRNGGIDILPGYDKKNIF